MYVVILRWMLCLDDIQLFGRALRFQNNFWNNISARDAFPFVVSFGVRLYFVSNLPYLFL